MDPSWLFATLDDVDASCRGKADASSYVQDDVFRMVFSDSTLPIKSQPWVPNSDVRGTG